jgi:hypothetical protein
MADIPRFEVASVKPSRPVAGQGVVFGMVSDPSRFRGSFVTLADLVGKAYPSGLASRPDYGIPARQRLRAVFSSASTGPQRATSVNPSLDLVELPSATQIQQ